MRSSSWCRPALRTAAFLLAGCGRAPASAPVRARADVPVTSVISRTDARAPGCPARDGWRRGGTVHTDEVTGAERWRAEDSPHIAPGGVRVRPGATLELEPCALVRVGAARTVAVDEGGALVARGEALRPIAFEPLDAAPWAGVLVRSGASSACALVEVELRGAGGGGDPERVPASLDLEASGLAAQGLRVVGGRGWGIRLAPGAGFSTDTSLTVTGSEEGVAYIDAADDVASLPRGNYVRNGRDEVLVAGHRRAITRDATWGGRGVTYRVREGVRLKVGGPGAPRLRLEPSTAVRFGDDSALEVGVDEPGALWAEGAPGGRAVVLTASGEGAARWLGVTFGAHFDLARSAFRAVRVEGAGAPSGVAVAGCGCAEGVRGDAAALTFAGVDPSAVLADVLVRRASARGVAVAWTDGAAPSGAGPVARGLIDVAEAGVACAELRAPGASPCVADPIAAQGERRDAGARNAGDGGRSTGVAGGSRARR